MSYTFDEFDFNEPAENIIDSVKGVELPTDYIAFMREHNGGEGSIGEAYVTMFMMEELVELNEDYDIANTYKECFVFGSDGGDMLFAYNTKLGKYYQLDACNYHDDDTNRFCIADTLDSFFEAMHAI